MNATNRNQDFSLFTNNAINAEINVTIHPFILNEFSAIRLIAL